MLCQMSKMFLFLHIILLMFLRAESFLNPERLLRHKLITKNDTFYWLKRFEIKNVSASRYCEICCVKISKNIVGKICGSHTMCRYPGKTIGASCRGFINVQLTDEEKSAILDVHNSLRNKVALGLETIGNPGPQPPASNMRIIKWNNELSEIAQRWVAQCIFSHDLCRDTYNFPVGQNIGKGNLATDNELSLIFTWYNEVKNFSNEDVFNFQLVSDQKVSFERYTQMIWADTNMLGCARAIFQQTSGPTLSYIEHFVCNYGPTGNIPDQPVYNVGKPCSTCPEGMGCSLEYEGLCEINKEETNLMALDLDNSSLKLHKKNYFMYIYLTINLIKAAFY